MVRPILLSAAAWLLMTGCAKGPDQFTILADVPAPAGTMQALLVEDRSGGAAVGTEYDVYVVKGSEKLRFRNRVFSKEEIENVSLRWRDRRHLLVAYSALPNATNRSGVIRTGILAFENPFGVKVDAERRDLPN